MKKPTLPATLFCSLIAVTATPVFADVFQIDVDANAIQDLAHVKNCIDYTFCTSAGVATTQANDGTQFHVTIDDVATEKEITTALAQCNLKNLGLDVKVQNTTTQKEVIVEIPADQKTDIRDVAPNAYIPRYTPEQSAAHFQTISGLLQADKKEDAVKFILDTFQTQTYGYSVNSRSNVGANVSTTDHETKSILFGADFFSDPCMIMQAVRHEFDHVFQLQRAEKCSEQGKINGFVDHNLREVSAYLDDLYNLPIYCTDATTSDFLQSNAAENLVRYLGYLKAASQAGQ